jgi:TPR repeat protein
MQDCLYAKEVVAIDTYKNSGEVKDLLEIKDIERSQTNYILGKEYIEGKKVKKNLKKGLAYLNKSALDNNEEANLYLAKLYSNGKVLNKNTKKATSYYQAAAALGNKEAQQWLDNKKKR